MVPLSRGFPQTQLGPRSPESRLPPQHPKLSCTNPNLDTENAHVCACPGRPNSRRRTDRDRRRNDCRIARSSSPRCRARRAWESPSRGCTTTPTWGEYRRSWSRTSATPRPSRTTRRHPSLRCRTASCARQAGRHPEMRCAIRRRAERRCRTAASCAWANVGTRNRAHAISRGHAVAWGPVTDGDALSSTRFNTRAKRVGRATTAL